VQEGDIIQIRAKNLVDMREVTCINCSKILPSVRGVWARAWMLVAMVFR
jgi:hypothetical protein